MPLRFLLDEHLRGGALWHAIQRHNARGVDSIDAVRVGDPADLPLGTGDSDNLLWAEREGRILVSLDKNTLRTHLANHLAQGHRSPGVFIVRASPVSHVVRFLALVAHTSDAIDWHDRLEFIP
jgi:hypothetical protein